jgi:hypothetical protein
MAYAQDASTPITLSWNDSLDLANVGEFCPWMSSKRGNAAASTRCPFALLKVRLKVNIGVMSRADQKQRHTCQFHVLVSVIVRRGRAAYS